MVMGVPGAVEYHRFPKGKVTRDGRGRSDYFVFRGPTTDSGAPSRKCVNLAIQEILVIT